MSRKDRHPRACHCGDHAFAILTRGAVTLLDVDDLPLVAARCWSSSSSGRYNYARRGEKRGDRIVTIRMHRAIMQPPDDMQVDHANGDTLDNRRANLRICSHHENSWNSISNCGSEFKGVSWEMGGRSAPWRARISRQGQSVNLGCWRTAEQAAVAYDGAALMLFGEYAKTNFPPDQVRAAIYDTRWPWSWAENGLPEWFLEGGHSW